MASSRTSSVSSGSSIGTSGGTAATTYSTGVATGGTTTSGGSGSTVVVAGEATAVGTDTLVAGSVSLSLSSGSTDASVELLAAAEGPQAFATTSALIQPTGSVDRSISITSDTTQTWAQDGEVVEALSYTSASLSTVTFSGATVPPPSVVSGSPAATTTAEGPFATNTSTPAPSTSGGAMPTVGEAGSTYANYDYTPYIELDGNLAFFEIDASVFGTDTYLSVDVVTLTIENELSTFSTFVLGAVA